MSPASSREIGWRELPTATVNGPPNGSTPITRTLRPGVRRSRLR
jgi:hypothetical protein